MTDKLPRDYLDYPKRRYGQDHDRYQWSYKSDPAAKGEPSTTSIALIIPVERFVLNPAGVPFRAPGSMVTQYPDLRHFTSRDYGNRIGVYRLLKVLRTLSLPATFVVNASLLNHVAPLIDSIQNDGHEIAALGLDMDKIHWDELDSKTERQWVQETRELFTKANLHPTSWMSPARQQSTRTLDLIAEHGFTTCLDWEFDCTPMPMKTDHGDITMIPNLNELDDRKIFIEKRHSEDDWATQIIEAVEYSNSIATTSSPQGFAFTLTPYISGLPFRIKAIAKTLAHLKTVANFVTAEEMAH